MWYGPCQFGDHLPKNGSLVPTGNTNSQTRSPTWKFFGLTFLLWALETFALFSLICSRAHSQSSTKSSVLIFMREAYSSADRSFWNEILLEPMLTSHGETASWPYTSWYGEHLVDPWHAMRYAHNTSASRSCHCLGCSWIFRLISLIRLLLDASACPFAWA